MFTCGFKLLRHHDFLSFIYRYEDSCKMRSDSYKIWIIILDLL